MTESDVRGWRALPPAIVIALIADVLTTGAVAVWSQYDHGYVGESQFALVASGASFAVTVLAIVGCLQLADRLTGLAARGLRVAAIGFGVGIVLETSLDWYSVLHEFTGPGLLEKAWPYVIIALRVLPLVALVPAAWPHRRLAIAGSAVVALYVAARLLEPTIAGWLDVGDHGARLLWSVTSLLQTIAFALLAWGAARGTTAAEPRRAAVGLARAGGALRLRVGTAIAVTGIGLFVGLTGGGEGAFQLIKLGLISGLAINIVADLMIALGALAAARAELTDLPRLPLVLAGGCLAWCAGVLLQKAPGTYQVLYGRGEHGREAMDTLAMLSTAVMVAETLGIAVIAAAIAALANRRGLADLASQASGKGIAFVALMLASVGMSTWMLPEARSQGGVLMMLLCVLVAILAAMIMMARLCKLASEAVEREPGLPAAKVMS